MLSLPRQRNDAADLVVGWNVQDEAADRFEVDRRNGSVRASKKKTTVEVKSIETKRARVE